MKGPEGHEWSVIEQLVLTHAVVRSGENNWAAVSRSVRQFLGRLHKPPHPVGYYSAKVCASVYAALLEKEPKRKRSSTFGGVEKHSQSPKSVKRQEPQLMSAACITISDKIRVLREAELQKVVAVAEARIQEVQKDVQRLKAALPPVYHSEALPKLDVEAMAQAYLPADAVAAAIAGVKSPVLAAPAAGGESEKAATPKASTDKAVEAKAPAAAPATGRAPPAAAAVMSAAAASPKRGSGEPQAAAATETPAAQPAVPPATAAAPAAVPVKLSEAAAAIPVGRQEQAATPAPKAGIEDAVMQEAAPLPTTVDETPASTSHSSVPVKPLAKSEEAKALPATPARTSLTRSAGSVPPSPLYGKAIGHSLTTVWRVLYNHRCAKIFHEPVTDKVAPGYFDVIKQPMDLSTIKCKLSAGEYPTATDFYRDVQLMIANALYFNPRGSECYDMAKTLKRVATKEMETIFEAEERMQQSRPVTRHKRLVDSSEAIAAGSVVPAPAEEKAGKKRKRSPSPAAEQPAAKRARTESSASASSGTTSPRTRRATPSRQATPTTRARSRPRRSG